LRAGLRRRYLAVDARPAHGAVDAVAARAWSFGVLEELEVVVPTLHDWFLELVRLRDTVFTPVDPQWQTVQMLICSLSDIGIDKKMPLVSQPGRMVLMDVGYDKGYCDGVRDALKLRGA
jgi:hypothetical protein